MIVDYRIYLTAWAILAVAWFVQLFKIELFEKTAPVIGSLAVLLALAHYLDWLWS